MGTKKSTQHVCKPKYIIDKALTSKTSGFITLRRNKEVDLTADLLLRVYQGISKEPALSTTTTTTNDDLRADINSRGFWQRMQRTFVDIRLPFRSELSNSKFTKYDETHGVTEIRKHNRRALDGQHGTFTPLVFTTNGVMSFEPTRSCQRLSKLLSVKLEVRYI